ncbi:MAG TPA: PfkB family carbohydrate kinase, partial [Spirochaetota bacterium]|nr:PfkB family carbohydrate kinase [Spirochaetota bacterium]
HVLIGNEEHLALFLLPNSEKKHDIHSTIQALFNTYANLSAIVITYREGTSASEVRVGAAAATRNHEVAMKTLEVPHIVDRIGAGDALAAGFIYSLIQQQSLETAVDTALALCALAHSVHGDNFIVGKADMDAIIQNKSSRLLR